MTDRPRDRARHLPAPVIREQRDVLTASSQLLQGGFREQYAITYKTWQDELWAYTVSVGEFSSTMNWFAAGMGRMHLRAGVWKPGLREPELLTEGPAADLVNDLVTNAKGGETQFLRTWAKHLFVPGVGFFLAEEIDGRRRYDVKSADVIKRSAKQAVDPATGELLRDNNGEPIELYDIRIAPDRWRTTTPNSLVGRIFDPDPRYDYFATSMTQGALTTLREIDLYNRAIVATLLSRIAFNGILFIPEEVTFPVNPQFKDAPDPFIAELLHYAQRGIKDPGSPGAAIPFPLRVNSQFIESFKHLILSSGLDPKIIEARESAVTRLQEQLPAPPEATTGLQDMNHWNAWKSSEDNVKLYFGPPMEILCGGLTELFLHPMLHAANKPLTQDGGRIVMWYDASDLTIQPDNSENAGTAFDKGRMSSDAYMAAIGFDPADSPKPDQKFREWTLMKLAMSGTPIPDSFYLLYPEDKPEPVAPETPVGGAPGDNAGPSTSAAPSTGTPPQERPEESAP